MSFANIHLRLKRSKPTNRLCTGDFVEVGIWSGIEIDIGVLCTCLPSIRILIVRYAPRCMGMGSSADESDHPSRPSAQGEQRRQRRLRKRSYVNFDVEGGGSSGRSAKSTLTAVASTPGGSSMFMEGKKSPWEQSEFRLATFKRHSTEMVDDVVVPTKD